MLLLVLLERPGSLGGAAEPRAARDSVPVGGLISSTFFLPGTAAAGWIAAAAFMAVGAVGAAGTPAGAVASATAAHGAMLGVLGLGLVALTAAAVLPLSAPFMLLWPLVSALPPSRAELAEC